MRKRTIPEAAKVTRITQSRLDEIEADPRFRAMIRQSDRDIKEGRVTSHEEVVQMSKALAKRKAKRSS